MSDVFNAIQTIPNTVSTVQKIEQPKVTVQDSIPAANVASHDKVEISSGTKEKKGFIASVKGGISGMKKFFASTGAYIKGTAKGIGQGAVVGSLIYTGGSIVNAIKGKKANAADFKKLPNRALAIVGAGLALAANLWTASLNATEAKSNIDHRWKGHNQ